MRKPKTGKTIKKKTAKTPLVEKTPVKKAAKRVERNEIEVPIVAEDKQKVIEEFAQKPGDTGSPEVQVALLTQKINRLTSHLGENKKDDHSRRGLLKVIAKRRRILNYLLKLDEKRYKDLIKKLGLKK